MLVRLAASAHGRRLGSRVQLSTPVRTVAQTADGVQVGAPYDGTPADNSLGGILAFVGGDKARRWDDDHEAVKADVLPPGARTQDREAIRAPIGRIHWARTEAATYWHGHMDRAISSGRRAAAEVLRG